MLFLKSPVPLFAQIDRLIHFLLHFDVCILVAAQRSFNDLSKAAKRSGTKFVRRIQRQSSFVLPRKKPPPVSIQFTQQQPIQRGTTFIKYLDLSCTLFTFYHFSFPRMDLRLLNSSLSFISLRKSSIDSIFFSSQKFIHRQYLHWRC